MTGSQVVLGPPTTKESTANLGGDRTKNHKFTFDYAYWSHDKNSQDFADQVRQVLFSHLHDELKIVSQRLLKLV